MTGFRVEVEAARAMAGLHDKAAAAINELAGSQPSGLDGGIGGPFILQMLSAVSRDAGSVAQIDTSVGVRVRTAVDLVKGYDTSAAGTFRALEQGMP